MTISFPLQQDKSIVPYVPEHNGTACLQIDLFKLESCLPSFRHLFNPLLRRDTVAKGKKL